jgi:hypothetical protein
MLGHALRMNDAHHGSPDRSSKKTRTGRCNCGAVRFEAECDTRTGTRCNCSICTRLGVLTAILQPGDVRVLAGEEHLTGWGGAIGTRYFCKTCGIHCFARGYLKEVGGDYATVNFLALDGFDPIDTRVLHWDGRHDNWQAGTREEPWPVVAG